MFGWVKKNLFGKQPEIDPFDQCVIEFIEESKRQGCVPTSYNHETRSFQYAQPEGGVRDFQPGNLFATWLPLDQHGRAEVVANFVRSIDESRKNAAISPEMLPDQLMPGIRARALIGSALLQNWIAGAPADATSEIAWFPFAGDLGACVIRDQPLTMAPMARDNLKFADLALNQAMATAMANFRARMPAPIFEPVGDGVFGCTNFEDHQSALLLLEPANDYALPPVEGVPVALVPGRNVFYLTGSANMAGLARLLDIAATADEIPNFCSSILLQWSGDGWSEFHFDPDTANARRQQWISQGRLTADYAFQKQLLDRYYQQQGLDISVSEVMVFEKSDQAGSVVSVTTLASGARGTLLPQTERLCFVKQTIDPRTGWAQKGADDIVDVTWSEAMDVVGPLFEPVANLYPPRFRVEDFPNAEAWKALKLLTRRF